MIVQACQHSKPQKHGRDRKGNQRFRCKLCGATWIEDTHKPLGDMRISMKDACTALGMLLEGMSIRATSRLTGLDRNTIHDLILVVGENCQRLMDSIRDVDVENVEIDEIWSFNYCKEKVRIARGYGEECGDSWTFLGACPDT